MIAQASSTSDARTPGSVHRPYQRRSAKRVTIRRMNLSLEPWKKLILATLGITAAAIPLSIGLAHPPKMRAQSPLTAAQMRFEVASIKFPADQSILETRPRRTVGRFRWKTQLMYLLGYAYQMEWWRISEKPTGSVSLGSIYEIEATTGPDTSEDQERLMLQTLLIERFKMVVHREIKDAVQGYALTVTKDGPRMEAAREEKASDDPTISDGWVSAHGLSQGVIAVEGRRATMLQLTENLQRLLSTSVLDQTGLTGKYNFQVEFERGDDPSDYTSVVAAVRRLGLKLERYKGPVEFLVIDHLDKLAEN
ncbi:MAG TPA: TIGR03435 family protein [Candidatus Acidoferrales bacterium]|jgi:uncharacterized protein (TIGR03435 family)|nr:TIGR03435 family protein [Candidatus Acidoferrales bacterium]